MERPNEEDEQLLQSKDAIFVSSARTANIIGKIQDKLAQLISGEINVVVFCSETVTVGLPDVQEAFKYIREEINRDPKRYNKLSGILFTESAEVTLTDIWGFHLLGNDNAARTLGLRLTKKLESLCN